MPFRKGDRMGLTQTFWVNLLSVFSFILKSILLLMINFMVTLTLGNPSPGDLWVPSSVCGILNVVRMGRNHGPHFCLDQTVPPFPTLEKIPLQVSRRVKEEATLRESGKSIGMRHLEISFFLQLCTPNQLCSLGQVVYFSGPQGSQEEGSSLPALSNCQRAQFLETNNTWQLPGALTCPWESSPTPALHTTHHSSPYPCLCLCPGVTSLWLALETKDSQSWSCSSKDPG